MQRVNLVPQANQQALTEADRESAVRIGGEAKHLISITRGEAMNEEERRALESLTFNWTSALEDVWRPSPYHVEGLHVEAVGLLRRGIEAASRRDGSRNPLGLPLQGERGVGKTHLLGWARSQVQAAGGYFFLLGDLTHKTFWDQARTAVVQQLQPLRDGSRDQLGRLLGDLADRPESRSRSAPP